MYKILETSQGNGDGLRIGCIVIWSNNTSIPEEYLECNGQAVNAILYPKLSAIMSYTPDFQGIFLRGYGNQIFSQNNGSTIGVTSTTYSSGLLGEIQGDAIRNIYASLYTQSLIGDPRGAFESYVSPDDGGVVAGDYQPAGIRFNASKIVPTSTENRPINKAVRYLIKAK